MIQKMTKKASLLLCFLCIPLFAEIEEKRIVIVSASYNNKAYYQRMLNSVFAQKYSNWHLMYVDDCSTDGTGDLVESYVAQKGFADRVTLIKNSERLGSAIANQYSMIHQCNNQDIVVILDADDWFAGTDVLAYLNQVYADPNVWLTYGQFREYPSGARGFCCPMPRDIVRRNAFRQFVHLPSHLRTFYAGLFKKINKEDLMMDGEFLSMTGDLAAMIPMIEMACDHFKFIPHVLLIYNAENPLNDHKKSKSMQRRTDLEIRSRKPYKKLSILFDE